VNDLMLTVQEKVNKFIENHRGFDKAFQLDLNSDRLTSAMIWDAVKNCRAMSNTVAKYLADTEQLERHIGQRVEMAEEALEDAVMVWIQKLPEIEYKRFAKEERRRLALLAHEEIRQEAVVWNNILSEVSSFKKTLILAMENIRGARKDILGAIGAAKLENSWEPGALGREVDLHAEAMAPEFRLK